MYLMPNHLVGSVSLTTILHSSRTKHIRPSQMGDMTAVDQMLAVSPFFSYLLQYLFSFSPALLLCLCRWFEERVGGGVYWSLFGWGIWNRTFSCAHPNV